MSALTGGLSNAFVKNQKLLAKSPQSTLFCVLLVGHAAKFVSHPINYRSHEQADLRMPIAIISNRLFSCHSAAKLLLDSFSGEFIACSPSFAACAACACVQRRRAKFNALLLKISLRLATLLFAIYNFDNGKHGKDCGSVAKGQTRV